jgi:hypothetical protein
MDIKPFTPRQCLSTVGAQEATMDGEEFSTKHSAEFKMKILKRVKELTNYGKHKEAEELFKIYFTNFSKLGEQNGKN